MRSEGPPRTARWLLQHFGSSPSNESVIGDLEESYASGHSALWYWKQVLVTIVVAWFAEIASNKVKTLSILAISCIHLIAVGTVFRYLASGAANPLTSFTFTNLLPYSWWGHNIIFWPVDWLLTWSPLFLISLTAGWTVAASSRGRARAMILTAVMFSCSVLAVPTCRMLLNFPNVPPYFGVRELFVPFQTIVGIVLGGGLRTRPAAISLKKGRTYA